MPRVASFVFRPHYATVPEHGQLVTDPNDVTALPSVLAINLILLPS